jgi:paraquat-inducible protein A
MLDAMTQAASLQSASDAGTLSGSIAGGEDRARIACPSCDLLYDVSNLPDGGSASCTRCGNFLTRRKDNAVEHASIYCIAALVMMAVACAFPFMQFSRSGLENTMTLPQTVLELWINNMPWLAIVVASFILIIPALVTVCMLVLSIVLSREHSPPWLRQLGSTIFHLQNWSMVEVFFVGVLVSLVKIAKLATIVLGTSFWAYGAFTVLFILATTNLDKFQCWQRIEQLSKQ